jgi:TRAP-type uncharacterized transport system substrate-binding protein
MSMFGLGRGHLLKGLTVGFFLTAASWAALWYFIPAPPSTISIASGARGGGFEQTVEHYREKLARHHVTLDVRPTEGSADSLRLVEDRSSGVSAAYFLGGTTNSERSPGLMSLGRINFTPVWPFYRGTEPLDRLTQLKGKRVVVGLAFSQVASQILAAHGVNSDNSTLLPLIGLTAIKALKDGEADAIFIPFELNSPILQSLLRDPAVRLMSLTQAEALTRLFPYLTRLVLPQGVIDLEKNIPASDVSLIAITNPVVVRKDLHPELVYLLAQTLAEEHGGSGIFERAGDFPTQTDPEFPVAEEARDFYKNGPSFLQRYLPFWMLNIAKRTIAISVTVIAIIIPIFSFLPRLYEWFLRRRMATLYRRLRMVEKEMQKELTAAEAIALQADLENIEQAARYLPMRHSDLLFAFELRIDLTRTRLAKLHATNGA